MINHRRVLGVAVVVLLVSSMMPVDVSRVVSGKPRHIVEFMLRPALLLFGVGIGGDIGGGTVVHDADVQKLYEQTLRINEMLRQENAELRTQVGQLTDIERLLDMTTHTPVPATVVSWSGNRGLQTLGINRGSKQGLRAGQVVVSGVELVGVVSDVGTVTGTVKLITSSGSKLYVTISSAGSGGGGKVREGLTQLDVSGNGREFVATAGIDAGITVGDVVHLADASFAGSMRGYFVGRVVSVDPLAEDPTLRRRVVVRPGIDFTRLRRVVVMVGNDDGGGAR